MAPGDLVYLREYDIKLRSCHREFGSGVPGEDYHDTSPREWSVGLIIAVMKKKHMKDCLVLMDDGSFGWAFDFHLNLEVKL